MQLSYPLPSPRAICCLPLTLSSPPLRQRLSRRIPASGGSAASGGARGSARGGGAHRRVSRAAQHHPGPASRAAVRQRRAPRQVR
eukprot:3913337-Rhodomonas_salina.2